MQESLKVDFPYNHNRIKVQHDRKGWIVQSTRMVDTHTFFTPSNDWWWKFKCDRASDDGFRWKLNVIKCETFHKIYDSSKTLSNLFFSFFSRSRAAMSGAKWKNF